jgi:glycogen debranching enzyme
MSAEWRSILQNAIVNFRAKFWEQERGYLLDVIDCDHQAGAIDRSVRPNQLLACGGLPHRLLERHRVQSVLKIAQAELMTPMGLRSLSSWDERYQGRYAGSMAERDRTYHQGTIWPWLIGSFVDAWVWAAGDTAQAKKAAFERFVVPIRDQSMGFGMHHIAEIAEGDPPHRPDGCPFQAWSLGELIRAAARCDKLQELVVF